MKKTLLTLAFLSAVSAGLFAAEKADLPDEAPFSFVRNANIPAEKLSSIHSTRLLYKLTGSGVPDTLVLIRAKQFDKLRLDLLIGGEHLVASTDGEAFWIYNKKEGRIAMNEDDVKEFVIYAAMLPVPICSKPAFSNAKKSGADTVNGVARTGYVVRPLEETDCDLSIKLWIEDNTRLLRKAERMEAGERTRVMFYRDYRDFNGIKAPVYVSLTNDRGPLQMELISADWNIELDDVLFTRKGKIVDRELDAIMKSPSSPDVKKAAAEKRKSDAKIEQLERKINKLKLEIAACEKGVNRAERIEDTTRSSSTGLADVEDGGGHWYYWGGYGHGGGTHSGTNIRRKQINLLNDEKKGATRSYESKSQKLLQLQIDLSNAEYELNKLLKAQEAAASKTEGIFD